MKPPIVYEETKPTSHSTIKMTAMVSNILPLLHPWGGADQNPVTQRPTALREVAIPGSAKTETQSSAFFTFLSAARAGRASWWR